MPDDKHAADTTHFGYRTVAAADKAGLVRGVFDSVASRYDVMNDLMSAGLHRLWKRMAVEETGVHAGDVVLDLAGGTGDLAVRLARRTGDRGHVVLADINHAMLREGRRRLVDAGTRASIAQVDAERLPFADRTFDCVTIAFGLRNVTDKDAALASMFRVLKPGGRVVILEFSKPVDAVRPAYDAYSFNVLPALGKLIADDAESYRYLAESIRMHPDQEVLLGMMRSQGFERCRYSNLAAGIVALHVGYRL
ncbi:MAG: bifunctional demethylmenaquinone methyltransferase/2-methoxy-6-polyprenyl-1,4-benzoquinol methylase UbiE [Woeseiaceae bacterium]|nr:bifunctional demethylmenaquinone methyltransferase/2-methoxy-6-polyprenyl-1,4-benzoquinol methylase UbiE [Woeseiaceae bacterium]